MPHDATCFSLQPFSRQETLLRSGILRQALVPQGGSQKSLVLSVAEVKVTHSKVLWNKLFRDFKWLLYLRRGVLASGNVRRGATRSEGFPQVEEPAVWAGLAT